jgi:integrase
VKTCDDLTVGKLMAFRTALNSEAQTAFTFNKWLRPCKQMWKHWIRSQYCPRLNRGDLEDIELQEAKAKRRNFLNPAQIRKLLASTERHDLENLPIGPFVLFILLTGMRRGEGVSLAWDEVDFQAINSSGDAVGRIYLPGAKTKTKKERDVFLDVSPAVFQLLRVLRQRTGGAGFVFGLTTHQVDSAMKRLRAHYGAPKAFDYQTLRRTASTFLGNAHGVPNGGPYAASEQLGHSLEIMKRFYTGRVKVSPDCTSLESAMGVEDIAARIAGSSTFSKKRTFQS